MQTDDGIERRARLSPDGMHRWWLSRTWDRARPHLVWLMFNPSTADAFEDDATIRRCMSWARKYSYGGIVVVNLYAFRATDPRLLKFADDPVGDGNDATIRQAVAGEHVVCAWGSHGRTRRHRIAQVLQILRDAGAQLFCLGLTQHGQPKHPVRLPKDTEIRPWLP